MSNLAQHVQREVPRFAERGRNLVGAGSFDVARIQLRNESPMNRQVRRISSSQFAAATIADQCACRRNEDARKFAGSITDCRRRNVREHC